MSDLEVNIEDKVVVWAKRHKFLTPKVKFVEAGYPDRLFISPSGHTIFMEFKRPGEVPSAIQEHRINELQKRGIPATWCDSVHEGIGILKVALETILGAPSLSEEGDSPAVVTGVSRALFGSGPREDLYRPGGFQDTEGEKTISKATDYRPPASGLEGVARRDKEVVRLLRPDAYNPTWGREGPKS